ncbi:ATP-binding cassette domain-containing protein, partial [Phocaeicola sp.]
QAENLTYVYLDQEYSIILNNLSVLEQLSLFNSKLYDYELKTILNRFLFPISTWDKKCSCLSGGEKMKLSLCCLMVSAQTPDIFIVDEPTNNIDMLNMEILTETLKDYQGTLLVVSHDAYFVQQIMADKQIELF